MNVKRLAVALATAAAVAPPATAQAAGYQDSVLADDPLTYLRVDEPLGSTIAQDSSPNDRDGAYAGGVTLGVAAPFVDSGTAAALAADGTVTGTVDQVSRTLELWVNPNRVARGQQVGIAAHGNPAADGWALGLGAKRKLAVVTAGARVQTKITLASNVWTQVTVTWSEDKIRFYVNGSFKKAFDGGPATSEGAFVLGGDGAGAFGGSFAGKLDEAALYPVALSAGDIQEHFLAARVPVNNSPPSITGTLAAGDTLTVQPGAWTDAATATRAYQWQRCDVSGDDCGDVDGATGTTYLLTAADACTMLQVAETVTNASGAGTAISEPYGAVAGECTDPAPDPEPTPDPGPTPHPDPDTGGSTGSGATTSTGAGEIAGVNTQAAQSSAGGCLRLVAGRRRAKLRRYGVLRLKVQKNACITAPIGAVTKAGKRMRLKSARYKLDGKRIKSTRFRAKLRPAKLTPGAHTLTVHVTPRAGRAKTFTLRLRLAVA
jgi:hypothetical protein